MIYTVECSFSLIQTAFLFSKICLRFYNSPQWAKPLQIRKLHTKQNHWKSNKLLAIEKIITSKGISSSKWLYHDEAHCEIVFSKMFNQYTLNFIIKKTASWKYFQMFALSGFRICLCDVIKPTYCSFLDNQQINSKTQKQQKVPLRLNLICVHWGLYFIIVLFLY